MKTFAIIVSVLAFTSCAADENIIAAIAAHGGPFPGIDGGVRDSGNGGASGEAGSGGSAGSGCAAIFPLTLPANPRIMPLGDSITYGTGDQTGGYRQDLWLALPTVQPIGTQSTPLPMAPGKDRHEGHPGYGLPAMAVEFPTWVSQTGAPDAVLLHGGTNDISDSDFAADSVESIYRTLMLINPRAILFVATPIIRIQDAPADWVALQLAQDAAIAARMPSLPRAIAVPMPALARSEMWDSFHPNDAGYLRMSNAWEAALAAIGVR
jgi:lysophospholipase L1-like esterase